MKRTQLLKDLWTYKQGGIACEQERAMLQEFISFVERHPDCFERGNRGHVTASVWIVNHEGTHALLTHHRKLKQWFQLGGHADGDSDTRSVAIKEAEEESGITGFEFVTGAIFDIDVHPIPSACEYHYDVRYFLRAPRGAVYQVSEESLDLAWVPLESVAQYSNEASVLRMKVKGCAYTAKIQNRDS